jgi:hypothetical protein
MLNIEQDPEECDARDDDSSTKAGQQKNRYIYIIAAAVFP